MPRLRCLIKKSIPRKSTQKLTFDDGRKRWKVPATGTWSLSLEWLPGRVREKIDVSFEVRCKRNVIAVIGLAGSCRSGSVALVGEESVHLERGDLVTLHATNRGDQDCEAQNVLIKAEPQFQIERAWVMPTLIQTRYSTADLGPDGNVRLAQHTENEGPVIESWSVPGEECPDEADLLEELV